jgi:hypothetical protein
MTVRELIERLQNYKPDLEIGYVTGRSEIELLIGEDENSKDAGPITIKKVDWA